MMCDIFRELLKNRVKKYENTQLNKKRKHVKQSIVCNNIHQQSFALKLLTFGVIQERITVRLI